MKHACIWCSILYTSEKTSDLRSVIQFGPLHLCVQFDVSSRLRLRSESVVLAPTRHRVSYWPRPKFFSGCALHFSVKPTRCRSVAAVRHCRTYEPRPVPPTPPPAHPTSNLPNVTSKETFLPSRNRRVVGVTTRDITTQLLQLVSLFPAAGSFSLALQLGLG